MARYVLVVDGVVGNVVASALEGFEVRPSEPGRSCLVGEVVDQAALHGLLQRLEDLAADIIEVRRLDEA